jgi:hypothetical protein
MLMSRLRGCNVIQPSTSKAITSASVASITASRPSLVAAAVSNFPTKDTTNNNCYEFDSGRGLIV